MKQAYTSMFAKRLLDILVSMVGLFILSPVFALLAVLIKLDSSGPVIFKGLRIGQHGKPFQLLKFRSMVQNAPAIGSAVTANGDPRITRVGHIIRKTKLDELPSLWNVLTGEMSLVGPRPESPSWVVKYTPEQRKVLEVMPGVTGLAQIKYRDEESLLNQSNLEEDYVRIMNDKLAIDLDYIRRWSFWLDLRILFETVFAIITPEGGWNAVEDSQ